MDILAIDDNEIDMYLIKRIVERSTQVNHALFFDLANDALEHLKQSESRDFPVILLDINMPVMNGFEFLEVLIQQLGETAAELKVFMLTTSDSEFDKAKARSFDIVKGYLTKPFTVTHLELMETTISRADITS